MTVLSNSLRVAVATFLILLSCRADAVEPSITRHKTPEGVEYGIWGTPKTEPAPMLFMLAGTIESTLEKPYFRQCGNELEKHGYVVVSIDIPCHGTQAIAGQPSGLTGWSHRVGKNEDIVAECNNRLSLVLDELIKNGTADPDRIAVGGTSRGGFLAIHFAAHDQRVKCAAAFAPVTVLSALNEFSTRQDHPLATRLNLISQKHKLVGRPVWIVIGDSDKRVGTQHAIDLATELSSLAKKQNVPNNVKLHVMPEPRGHTTPKGSSSLAAKWILRHLPAKKEPIEKPAAAATPSPKTASVSDQATDTITRHEYTDKASGVETPYLLYHPAAKPLTGKCSLLIYLHGAGGSLNGYNYKRAPYAVLREQLARRGYYVVVPALGKYHFMNDQAKAALDGIVEQVLKQQGIPDSRIHVMGTSMGAGSSLAYAIHRPDMIRSVCAVMPMTSFSAWVVENPRYAVPVANAYGGTFQQIPDAYNRNSAVSNIGAFEKIPVMLIHGTADSIVRYEHSQKLAELLQSRQYECVLCTARDLAHKDDVMQDFQTQAADFFDAATN